MERLTRRISGVVVYVGAKNPYSTGQIPCEVEPAGVRETMNRLAAYEDTGLTPEEVISMSGEWCAMMSVLNATGSYDGLRKLAEADRDGRLVVLPCKVGDVMYELFREYTECTSYQTRKDDYCCEGCMVPCDSREVTVIRAIQPKSLPEVVRYIDGIGKTVFLTHEEAEKALEAMKDE